MICETCGNNFFEDWRKDPSTIKKGPPRFCSYSCSRSRKFSKATKNKIRESGKQAWENGDPSRKERYHPLSTESRQKSVETNRRKRELRTQKALERGRYEDLSIKVRRKLLFEEANNTCQSCGNKEWLGKPIWLEIHRKNDNDKDNRKENLIVVCLNCHSALDENYRFRGRKHASETELVASALSYKQV